MLDMLAERRAIVSLSTITGGLPAGAAPYKTSWFRGVARRCCGWIAPAPIATNSAGGAALAERFHIAEWYGRPFLELTDTERVQFAQHKVGGSAMKKSEVARLTA